MGEIPAVNLSIDSILNTHIYGMFHVTWTTFKFNRERFQRMSCGYG